MKWPIIYFTVLIIFSGCKIPQQSKNILHIDFEKLTESESRNWDVLISSGVDSCKIGLTKNAHSGKSAFQISRVWTDGWSMAGIEATDLIPVSFEKKYLLNFWYKTENVFEFTLPLTVRFRVMRRNHKPLDYSKNLSWSENNWKQAFLLLENLPDDADSVKIQLFTRFRIKGSILIDDIQFAEATATDIESFEVWRRQNISNPIGNSNAFKAEPTGFFHLEKNNERWWLIDSNGNPTWSIGTMAAMPGKSGNGNIEFYEWYKEKYGENKQAFATMLYDTFESWGFNSFAGWTSNEFAKITADKFEKGENYFPMFSVLGLSRMGDDRNYYAKNRNGDVKDGEHSVVDPFNPEWQKDARLKAEQLIPEYRDKSWFVGWYIDNEIELNDLFKFVWAEYSGKEFIKQLQQKYETIDKLNEKWSSRFGKFNYSSFGDILNDTPEPKDWDDPLYKDFIEFERFMVKTYIDFTYDLVKELDPNHLVISNRLHLGPMSDLYRTIDLWGKYDLICMNIYPQNLLFGFSPGELELMNRLHRNTGKPVIIGEWSVPAIGPELYSFGEDPFNRPLDWSWPQVVRNQQERGEVYNACMMQLASMDFVVGAGWFKPIDVNSSTRRANRGLINGKFQPYSEMISAIKVTNLGIKEKMKLQY